MNPQTFARAVVSIEAKYGLRLDAAEVWLRLDAKQVLRKIGGRRPGKRCKGGWISAEKQCSDHKTSDGKLTAAGKSSAAELAGKVRSRKGMQPIETKNGERVRVAQGESTPKETKSSPQRTVDFEVKESKPLDIESISSGSIKANESKVRAILKSGFQSELPVVVIKAKKGSVDIDLDTYSGAEEVASYREAVKRNPNLKGRMDVIIAGSKEEAIAAAKQQKLIAKHSKVREPIKEARLLDVESFKTRNTDFKQTDIEDLAQSISQNGGIYQGPQVRQSGAEEWTTRSRSDDFAVLAYRRAQEMNPQLKGRLMAQFV